MRNCVKVVCLKEYLGLRLERLVKECLESENQEYPCIFQLLQWKPWLCTKQKTIEKRKKKTNVSPSSYKNKIICNRQKRKLKNTNHYNKNLGLNILPNHHPRPKLYTFYLPAHYTTNTMNLKQNTKKKSTTETNCCCIQFATSQLDFPPAHVSSLGTFPRTSI